MERAAYRTKLLIGSYRKGDAEDPEIYAASIMKVLANYPSDCVDYVTDPETGLATKGDWLPTIREVKAACEEFMAPQRREAERQRVLSETRAAIEVHENRDQRPTLEQMVDKYGENWGITKPGKPQWEPRDDACIAAELAGIQVSDELRNLMARK